MVKIQEIKATISGVDLNHRFFDFLNQETKKNAHTAIKQGIAHIVSFKQDDNVLFAAVIELLPDTIHVMHVGGKFPRHIAHLKTYCEALAIHFKKKSILFGSKKDAVKHIGEKLGFTINSEGEYEYQV